MKKYAMFLIALAALVIWFVFWYLGQLGLVEAYPAGYLQKIFFGLIVACFGFGGAFLWIKFARPDIWDLLNPATKSGVNSISEWHRVKVSLFWVAAFLIAYLIGVLAL